MRRDLLVNALSEYSLEDIMSMVGESHQISKERKELPQEKIQQLADELKNLQATNIVHIPVDVKGTLKVNLEWWGSEEVHIENFEFEVDAASINNEGASCIKQIIDEAIVEGSIEDLPSESIKKILKRKDAFSDQILKVAEEYHIDEWELHSDVMDLGREESEFSNPPRRRMYKARKRSRRKRRL